MELLFLPASGAWTTDVKSTIVEGLSDTWFPVAEVMKQAV
jgi:hypothetical protein